MVSFQETHTYVYIYMCIYISLFTLGPYFNISSQIHTAQLQCSTETWLGMKISLQAWNQLDMMVIQWLYHWNVMTIYIYMYIYIYIPRISFEKAQIGEIHCPDVPSASEIGAFWLATELLERCSKAGCHPCSGSGTNAQFCTWPALTFFCNW